MEYATAMSFWADMAPRERRTFWGCFGGWALDGMDFQFYGFVIPAVIAEWHLSRTQAGTIQTTTLLCSAGGGGLAGLLRDRIRRGRAPQRPTPWDAGLTGVSGRGGA